MQRTQPRSGPLGRPKEGGRIDMSGGGQSASRGDALSLSKKKCCMRLVVRGKLKEALHVALKIEGNSSMQ